MAQLVIRRSAAAAVVIVALALTCIVLLGTSPGVGRVLQEEPGKHDGISLSQGLIVQDRGSHSSNYDNDARVAEVEGTEGDDVASGIGASVGGQEWVRSRKARISSDRVSQNVVRVVASSSESHSESSSERKDVANGDAKSSYQVKNMAEHRSRSTGSNGVNNRKDNDHHRAQNIAKHYTKISTWNQKHTPHRDSADVAKPQSHGDSISRRNKATDENGVEDKSQGEHAVANFFDRDAGVEDKSHAVANFFDRDAGVQVVEGNEGDNVASGMGASLPTMAWVQAHRALERPDDSSAEGSRHLPESERRPAQPAVQAGASRKRARSVTAHDEYADGSNVVFKNARSPDGIARDVTRRGVGIRYDDADIY
jgi:hypothetical protein